MKILQLVQKPQLRGAEVFACQLSDQINSLGHEAFVVTIFKGDANLPLKTKQFHLSRNPKKRNWDFAGYKGLADIISSEKPDIIQANAGDTLRYAVISQLLFRWPQPVVFRNASTISLYIKSKPSKLFYGFFFSRVKKIISVSNTSAADFGRLYPKYQSKILTIPIGIQNHQVFPNRKILGGNGPILIHVGGFSYEKNHRGIISIFQKLVLKCPTATLHLVGSGLLLEEIKADVFNKGLSKQVIFHGHQPNAIQLIASADVLILPSIIEGLPGVILEAFYCKVPVVAYDVGGIGEVVINNETGRLIKKGDESLFVQAILSSLEKNEHNSRLVDKAYQMVCEHYLNSFIAKKFLNTYESVLN